MVKQWLNNRYTKIKQPSSIFLKSQSQRKGEKMGKNITLHLDNTKETTMKTIKMAPDFCYPYVKSYVEGSNVPMRTFLGNYKFSLSKIPNF